MSAGMTAGPLPHPLLAAIDPLLPDLEGSPPREWLLGAWLERGCISLLAAPGGTGMSALALAMAASLASGRDLLGRLFLGDGWRVVMASTRFGGIQYPDQNAILSEALAREVGLIVVDPFVTPRKVDGTSAMHMDLAATAWTRVAQAARCAALLVHPVRKVSPWGGVFGMEAASSVGSLADAASSAGLLSGMRADEARRLGVPARERCAYARLDDAKQDLAPHAAQAR